MLIEETCGSPYQPTAADGSGALPFVIPSGAEGSAVSTGPSWECFSRKRSGLFEARRACPELVEGADRQTVSPARKGWEIKQKLKQIQSEPTTMTFNWSKKCQPCARSKVSTMSPAAHRRESERRRCGTLSPQLASLLCQKTFPGRICRTADPSASLGGCDFLSFLVVCGRKAPQSICQQASPGSFDCAP